MFSTSFILLNLLMEESKAYLIHFGWFFFVGIVGELFESLPQKIGFRSGLLW